RVAKEVQPDVNPLINEIKKKIKIFSDLGLEISDCLLRPNLCKDLESKSHDALSEMIYKIDDVLSSDRVMIKYIQENDPNSCAACKFYNIYKKIGNCQKHD